ncbi:MAG: Colicin V production protein [Gammaproteobacteria bacterium]|nr:Colicin V production protein [Gammaproteobacteria bacterium]
MHPVDIGILAIVGISALLSLLRGLVREVLSLAAWVVAFFVARTFNPVAAGWMAGMVSVPSAQYVLGFGLLFFAVLLAMGVVNYVLVRVVAATGLSPTDRMLGVIFGVLRGVGVVILLVFLASFTPMTRDPWWTGSLFVPKLLPAADWLRAKIPPELQKYLPE